MAEVDIDFSLGEGAMVEETKEEGAEMDIDFSSAKGMVTGKVDEEMKEAGVDVDTNNPMEMTKEERFGNHLLRNSNPALIGMTVVNDRLSYTYQSGPRYHHNQII